MFGKQYRAYLVMEICERIERELRKFHLKGKFYKRDNYIIMGLSNFLNIDGHNVHP